jgi:hypothetical protein
MNPTLSWAIQNALEIENSAGIHPARASPFVQINDTDSA